MKLAEYRDEKLAEKAAKGSEKAFKELYERYEKKIYRYFLKMLNFDVEAAADFTQECFFRVIRAANRFDADRKFSTWIFSIAYNLCKAEYRKRANSSPPLDMSVSETAADKLVDLRDFSNEFRRETEKFDEKTKTVVYLRLVEEAKLAEIAEILDLPLGTVKSKLFYALKKLAKNLSHYKHI